MALIARRRLLLAVPALGLSAAQLAGCASPERLPSPASAPPQPTLRPGERWRYAKINRYNGQRLGEQVMQVETVDPVLRVSVSEGPGRALPPEIYADGWSVLQETVWDLVQRFNAPCPLLPRRLAPGASDFWRGTYEVPGYTGHRAWSVRIAAHDWERVQVPAGTFEALRVSRMIAFDHPDLLRSHSQREETLWYAPRVNRWVRREIDGRYVIPGYPPIRAREDRLTWELLDHHLPV